MALYQSISFLSQLTHGGFDTIHPPAAATPYSGVYRCVGCGHEIVSTDSHPLPPQNDHQHTAEQGHIRWRLIVAALHG